jgi:cleavage stimulation factor subunit 2
VHSLRAAAAALREDDAGTEQDRMMEMVGGAGPAGPTANATDPEKAPESISKAVASLPPENMFELMKQMKQCIQNNPQEARVMLNQNPQLAYALLQAQVVMR